MSSESSGRWPEPLGPCIHVAGWEEASGSQLQLSWALAIAAIWRVTSSWKASLSFLSFYSVKSAFRIEQKRNLFFKWINEWIYTNITVPFWFHFRCSSHRILFLVVPFCDFCLWYHWPFLCVGKAASVNLAVPQVLLWLPLHPCTPVELTLQLLSFSALKCMSHSLVTLKWVLHIFFHCTWEGKFIFTNNRCQSNCSRSEGFG